MKMKILQLQAPRCYVISITRMIFINNLINYAVSNILLHNQPQRIKLKTLSKLGVIVLSIVLLTGISLVPTLQIGVQGRGQPHRLTTPATSPTPTTPPTSTATTASTTPRSAPAPPTDTTTTPDLDAIGEAANKTGGGGVINQSAMVMISQSLVMTMISDLQAAINAVDNDNKDEAMNALNSAEQQLKSAANAAGMSVENMTG
jgi:uncharacterized membrane protein YqhA